MWFKNLRLYRLNEALGHAEAEMEALLEEKLFQPCGKLDPVKYGWASPLGRQGKCLSHTSLGNTIFCAKRQEKVLPGASVNEALENKIFEIKENEGRPVGRKERMALKEDIVFSLLPQALTKTGLDFGYVATSEKLILVNASSSSKAEAFLNLLRESFGSLKVTPLQTHHPITPTLTSWLSEGRAPSPFEIGDSCELRADKDERVVRFRKQDLTAHEVLQHLEAGMHVKRLALIWKESIEFVVDEELAVKGLKYMDKLLEKIDDSATDTAADAFDNEFAIMSLELNTMTKDLIAAFGGDSDIF